MPYVLPITVSTADIDELGHVGNLVYVRWVLLAARRHSEAVGLGLPAFLARNQAFVVRRQHLDYLRPAFAGDVLAVETRVTDLRAASSERMTRILRPQDGTVLLRAVTSWAYVDLPTGRPARIPEEVRGRFAIEAAEDVL